MKKILLAACVLTLAMGVRAENDEPEQTGDNLDLNGVLDLFEQSGTVEEFENKLNSEKNDVNNLDLNDDGFVDYIRVIDYADGNTHSLTLQVPYSDKEAQDVAVIMLEDQGNESAVVQIVGDEDLYGPDYIVEPGEDSNDAVTNVHQWKVVRHIYAPSYVVWVSPWRFGLYPNWYRPWKPVPWPTYRARIRHYHFPYRRVTTYRCPAAHRHYHGHRVYSPAFHVHHPYPTAKSSGTKAPGGNKQKVGPSNKKVSKSANPAPAPVQKTTPAPQKTSAPSTTRQSTGKPTKRPGGNTKSSGRKSGGGKKH